MPDRDDRKNVTNPADADKDIDRGTIDPDVIRSRDSVGVGSEGALPPDTEETPIGRLGGHIAAGSTPVATSGGFDDDDGPIPNE